MSSLGIAEASRLRTYELLKGQSESVQRRVLGPNYKTEMGALCRRLEREPDPRPDVSLGEKPAGLCSDAEYAERRLYNRTSEHQKTIYLMIRRAAEQDDIAPSYKDLRRVTGCPHSSVTYALKRLEAMGAIERLPCIPRLGAHYRLPLVGMETRRP